MSLMIELHEGEGTTKKIWRFDGDNLDSYTRKDIVSFEIRELFPHLCKKGLHLNFYHYDLAGKINIESDGDLKHASS